MEMQCVMYLKMVLGTFNLTEQCDFKWPWT